MEQGDGLMRVLHIFTNPHLTNGATVFEYRISEFLKDENIFFDYLVTEQASDDELMRYKKMGSRVYKLPIDNNHGLLLRELKINIQYFKFFKNHHYDIVYADTENALRSIHLFMARLAGVKVRVVHSHNTGLQTASKKARIIARGMRGFFKFSATHYFASSDLAAEWLFPKKVYKKKKYTLLTNGVDLEKFEFNKEIRELIRTKYQITEDELVIGNVGRFMPQKNHEYLLEIFKKILQEKNNAKLMLIGTGPLMEEIQEKAHRLGIVDNVIFVGNIPNVNDYLQAMDVFLMPSLFEGLPITGIEAQANGLPCIFADTITQELKITKQAEYCSLNESVAVWAMRVLAAADKGRKDCREELISNGYSIKDTVKYLSNFYHKKGNI
mgnify:FL=1